MLYCCSRSCEAQLAHLAACPAITIEEFFRWQSTASVETISSPFEKFVAAGLEEKLLRSGPLRRKQVIRGLELVGIEIDGERITEV
jgi:hypothetical protein